MQKQTSNELRVRCINCNKPVDDRLLCDECFFKANGITREQWLAELEAASKRKKVK